MPEGDTIHRAAATLHRALAGKTVTSFESVIPAVIRGIHQNTPVTGRTVESVRAAGKHVLMTFSGDLILRSHMRMNGSWHIYRPGERWRKGRGDMRILLETADFVAVGFNVPDAEFHSSRTLGQHCAVGRLGPDLAREDFDVVEAVRRLRADGDREIAPAILDQSVMAGAGNVFKSEILFLCGIHPFRSVASLSDDQVTNIVETAHRLLRLNVGTAASGSRRTMTTLDPKVRLWVYGRSGEPCRRCGSKIEYRKDADVRGTYWCATCQPRSGGAGL